MKGWIKDHRQELESDIWAMPPLYHRVWQYIKYMANHEDNEIPMRDGSKMLIEKGQHLTSVRTIAQKVGWYERGIFKEPNPKTVQEVLNWLVKSNMIYTDKSNRKYTLVTVVNWGIYQGSEVDKVTESNNAEVTKKKQSMDINKNEENVLEETKSSNSSSLIDGNFKEVMRFYSENLQRGVTETPFNLGVLSELYETHGNELLMAAMKLGAKQEKKGVGYVEGILKNWKEAGVKTLDDARKHELEFKNKRTTVKTHKKQNDIDWDKV
jgi:DnaD/phage-associated family protein